MARARVLRTPRNVGRGNYRERPSVDRDEYLKVVHRRDRIAVRREDEARWLGGKNGPRDRVDGDPDARLLHRFQNCTAVGVVEYRTAWRAHERSRGAVGVAV